MQKITSWTWFYPIIEALSFFLIGGGVFLLSVENLGITFTSLSVIFIIHRVISTLEQGKIFSDRMDRLQSELQRRNQEISTIGSIVDLSQSDIPGRIRKLMSEYLAVTERKLSPYKDAILDDAISNISNLHHSKKTPVLHEAAFYKWLRTEFNEAVKNNTFEIVSMDEDLEWTDTPEERDFMDSNLKAAKRGAMIDRIFCFRKDRMEKARRNAPILQHLPEVRNGLNGYMVYSDEMQQKDPSAVKLAGQGFIIVNRQRVIVDRFEGGEARGYVTFEPSEVSKYIDAYESFKLARRPLNLN